MTYNEHKSRVLIVEDEPTIRHLLSHYLRNDYEIKVVASTKEALAVAAEHPFDVFLLDINLREETTGFDLLQALRDMPDYQDTPAVACTAYATHYNTASYYDGGFNGCVSKPFTRNALFDTLSAVLHSVNPFYEQPHARRHNLAA